ncbi:MAG TPA: acetyltransferase [Ruminococcaceae bacterium]|nr:acetyltransferase [Oscillospiraceae bacterium]
MTETEKMYAGKIYNPFCENMPEERRKAHELCQRYNATPETDGQAREAILCELMPNHGQGVYLQGPIQFDFGTHISMGKNSYANFNFCVLDENKVSIGDNVFIGPNCSMLTPIHPLCHEDRNIFHDAKSNTDINVEYSAPIEIKDNCWIGGSVTILPGVTVGEGCVIGAGSVVTKSIPPHSLAFGNPCRVVREITEADRLSNHPELFTDE